MTLDREIDIVRSNLLSVRTFMEDDNEYGVVMTLKQAITQLSYLVDEIENSDNV